MIKSFSNNKFPESVLKRFWDKVKKGENKNDCWNWIAAKDSNGYGNFYHSGKTRKAHIVSYEIHIGTVPAELQLDHQCENKRCVNPIHLEAVTQSINVNRSNKNNGRSERMHCKYGHEFNDENTYYAARGSRACRTCAKIKQQVLRNKRKVAVNV